MSNPELVIHFGKYKGRMIESIPTSYLKWLAENIGDDSIAVAAAESELQFRDDHSGSHFEEE